MLAADDDVYLHRSRLSRLTLMEASDLPTIIATLRYAASTVWPSSEDDARWMYTVADALEADDDQMQMWLPALRRNALRQHLPGPAAPRSEPPPRVVGRCVHGSSLASGSTTAGMTFT